MIVTLSYNIICPSSAAILQNVLCKNRLAVQFCVDLKYHVVFLSSATSLITKIMFPYKKTASLQSGQISERWKSDSNSTFWGNRGLISDAGENMFLYKATFLSPSKISEQNYGTSSAEKLRLHPPWGFSRSPSYGGILNVTFTIWYFSSARAIALNYCDARICIQNTEFLVAEACQMAHLGQNRIKQSYESNLLLY